MVPLNYDLNLVICSIIIAIVGSYLAVLSGEQFLFRSYLEKKNKFLILLSGFFLGSAIWLTHFVAMLAVDIPSTYYFDYALTLVSFAIAFIASTFAVWSMTQQTLTKTSLILGAILMGLGMSGMHYTGMMGLMIDHYSSSYHFILVTLSVLVAIGGSGLTFWLAFQYKKFFTNKKIYKLFLAAMMALTIVGMHYTGMISVSFNEDPNYKRKFLLEQNQELILFAVILITSVILVVFFIIALLEQRLEERNLQLNQANIDLANQAIQDNLTKLPNRLSLTEYTHSLFSDQREKESKSAFIYIDLDRFKAVNDVFGHHVGDKLLIKFSNRISSHLDKNEKFFRIGGDEFLLVIEDATVEYAMYAAEQLKQIIHESFLIAGKEINISSSIGVALFPEHGQNLQDLLMNADTAMLSSKHQGRNTYTVFNYSEDQLESKSQTKLINDLYKAVEDKQFILFYQPKFTAGNNKICGVEALIRWEHPKHGLLPPNMFIKGAEKTGLIVQIGYWVLEEACKQIHIWEENGVNFFPLAVNLSVVQFEHKHLFPTLEQLFEKYRINPNHLTIEITESTAMHNIDKSILSFDQLRQMGIKLAIDDFGTGHSSFLYLKNLPVDELKIDRAFIKDLEINNKDELILESIIDLAIKLGLTVTAEGVETARQAEILTKLGCQQLQGYLLGMPMPIDELEKL